MKLFNFKNDESGAVTVDWVVLAAALVVLAITISATLREPIQETVANIGTQIDAANAGIDTAVTEAAAQ